MVEPRIAIRSYKGTPVVRREDETFWTILRRELGWRAVLRDFIVISIMLLVIAAFKAALVVQAGIGR